MEGKKRRRTDDNVENRAYKFNVLLPNGITVLIVQRNPVCDMQLKAFLEAVKERSLRIMKQTEDIKPTREVLWDTDAIYVEDASGNKIHTALCFEHFTPHKIHYLWLIDGADHNADTFEVEHVGFDPDTDLLKELPDDYTFETALADLIDNALQAVWSNGGGELKLISVEITDNKISVFDTGPGMDGTVENSIVKWGKVGASLHRSSKKLGIGGRSPYLRPFFGMFGYGGNFASMHLGRHAIVSAKTKESKKVCWLRFEREVLLRRSDSRNWKVAGGMRDRSVDEIENSPHGSFTKIDMKPKLKLPNIFQLQCKLKDIYFPYIQCDEISKAGRTVTPVQFEVNGKNLAELDGGEFAVTNLHSCNGPDFILHVHFSSKEEAGRKETHEANARLKCVYFPFVKGKENIDRILDKLKTDGCDIKEDYETFSRISIRRLGRLLPDVCWDLLPFMKPKQKGGDRVQILKRCCLRVKCFIDTDAGFDPTPPKTDLAIHRPFTKALKYLGSDPGLKDKEVKFEIYRGEKQVTFSQLQKAYEDWVLKMHTEYDEEFDCGDDEPLWLLNGSNKEALGIKSDVVRVHRAISRKGMSWKSGQKVKILKGACPGCHKSNMYVTLEYFLLEGSEGDAGGEGRVIFRQMGVPDADSCVLTVGSNIHLELHRSTSFPVFVMDPTKCSAVGMDDWNQQAEKLNQKMPSTIEVLGLEQCKQLGIDGPLPTESTISAGFVPPKELAAVLRPSNFTSGCTSNGLDQKYIIKENYELCMDIKFSSGATKACQLQHIFSGTATLSSRKGCQGLYIFQIESLSNLFQKAGNYSFSFSIRKLPCISCELTVHVKASPMVKRWEIIKEDQNLQFSISVGSSFPQFSVARYDVYDNCVPFKSIPEIVFKLKSDDIMLSHVNKAKLEVSSDQFHVVVRNLHIITANLDKVRPSYQATLALYEQNNHLIISIPCRVMPGALQSVTVQTPGFSNSLLPKQVLQDIKLEMFDRHGNHVKEHTEVELTVHGFCFLDQDGKKREVDHLGFVDLSGLLKVTGGYGTHASISVLSAKEVVLMKKFNIEKRTLKIATHVPELCLAQSKLKDIAFEVVDSEGEIDQNIHDDDNLGESHTLKLWASFPYFDNSLRYAFRHGRCVVPSIILPRTDGRFFIEAFHSSQQELRLKFEVNVGSPAFVEDKMHSDHDGISVADEKTTASSASLTTKIVATPIQSPCKQSALRDEYEIDLFQSPKGNTILSTPFTPKNLLTLTGPDFQSLQLVEKELDEFNLRVQGYKGDLIWLGSHRDNIVKDLLILQNHDQAVGVSQKEVVLGAIENKVYSPASVCSLLPKYVSLKEKHSKFTSNMVGVVALLGSAPSHTLSRLFADYLGENQMLAIVCRSSASVRAEDDERELCLIAVNLRKEITGRHLLIYLEDISPYSGIIYENDPERRLALPDPTLPCGETAPGFLGYAVNMIQIDWAHLQIKTISGHGLRETLFYRLFGELQVYETKDHIKQAICSVKGGAISLDGGFVHGNGVISVGSNKVDVHFPVIAGENQIADTFQEIEKSKELSVAREAINHVCKEWGECKKHLEERKAEYQKLIQEKEEYIKLVLSPQSLISSSAH